jgi:hypothetical protein
MGKGTQKMEVLNLGQMYQNVLGRIRANIWDVWSSTVSAVSS